MGYKSKAEIGEIDSSEYDADLVLIKCDDYDVQVFDGNENILFSFTAIFATCMYHYVKSGGLAVMRFLVFLCHIRLHVTMQKIMAFLCRYMKMFYNYVELAAELLRNLKHELNVWA